ncbi:MAG TPA: DUF1697 domain-containing protein [Candidatus Polarisedimenticolaceae bacterium]|nr:DUF1697 domain-containing protein [Candidatus Polarisedimenticolaceae bacterium]
MNRAHVALIRGINVGRAKRVSMDELRKLVSGLGYEDVRTLLNSGNVVFSAAGKPTADEIAARIEQAMAVRLKLSARVIVLDAAELARVVAENPLLAIADDPSRLFVAVLRRSADRKLVQPLLERDWAPDTLACGKRAAYLWCPDGMAESPLALALARALGDSVTTRNWATFTKLHALVAGG